MSIVERDPWRMQYFEDVSCPDDVFIPTEDQDCYRLFPEHRWIYNKLLVAEKQGLDCAPHGIEPQGYPVFSKPIYNLRGMGMETRVFGSADEYLVGRDPGHMWCTLLDGEHLSSDVAVVSGEAVWWRHVLAEPGPHATFDYWTVLAAARSEVEKHCAAWIRQHFSSYTGMMNLETIGGKIIEGHLRFADQWPDLYGEGWLDALVALYAKKEWSYADGDRRDGYSVVLYATHDAQYRHPPKSVVEELRADPAISSVQVTFYEDKAPELHAMPPGGFRLAIINCWDLATGRRARKALAASFWETRGIIPKLRRR